MSKKVATPKKYGSKRYSKYAKLNAKEDFHKAVVKEKRKKTAEVLGSLRSELGIKPRKKKRLR